MSRSAYDRPPSGNDAPASGPSLGRINVYPIKSCGGIPLDEAEVDERGLRYDRRWMLVDGDGCFLSQRELPRLALVSVNLGPDALAVEAPGMPPLEVPLRPVRAGRVPVSVWGDVVGGQPVGGEADRWFEEFLGTRCSLVYMPDESVRPVDPDYGEAGDVVGFADGFPFLAISEASLDALNARLERPVPMNRFRPNLVIRGCGPFAEDGWRRVRVGSVTFRVVKPCARCVITTVDQETAAAGKEPLRTLARFRKVGSNVLFGQNLIHDSRGTLSVGDPVEVLE